MLNLEFLWQHSQEDSNDARGDTLGAAGRFWSQPLCTFASNRRRHVSSNILSCSVLTFLSIHSYCLCAFLALKPAESAANPLDGVDGKTICYMWGGWHQRFHLLGDKDLAIIILYLLIQLPHSMSEQKNQSGDLSHQQQARWLRFCG